MATKKPEQKPATAKNSGPSSNKKTLKIADVTAENVLADDRAQIEKSIAELYKAGKIDLDSTEISIPKLNVDGTLHFHRISDGLQIIFRGN